MASEGKVEELAHNKNEEERQAQIDFWKYVSAYTVTAAMKCAIELGIPDVLEGHEGPMSLNDLSSALSCSSDALYRVMRFLVHHKIFKEVRISQESIIGYVQTPLARLLIKNSEHSMANFVLLATSPVTLMQWKRLSACVLMDKAPPVEAANEQDVWRYAKEDPAYSKLFNDAMSCRARVQASGIINNFSEAFRGIKSVVDVGGGDGTALRMLVKAFPWIRGINFDLPHVVAVAPQCDGVEHVGGDMFDTIPKADVAFIMRVLHDWGDDECIKILNKCREAIPKETGKVMIVEAVVGEEGDEFKDVHLANDVIMMTFTNTGKERTAKEWAYVLNSAGFSRYTFKQIQTGQFVIEAYPSVVPPGVFPTITRENV